MIAVLIRLVDCAVRIIKCVTNALMSPLFSLKATSAKRDFISAGIYFKFLFGYRCLYGLRLWLVTASMPAAISGVISTSNVSSSARCWLTILSRAIDRLVTLESVSCSDWLLEVQF